MSDPTPMEQDQKQSQSRQSTREQISRRRFEIERKVFMIASHDDKEPKTVNEALKLLTRLCLVLKITIGLKL